MERNKKEDIKEEDSLSPLKNEVVIVHHIARETALVHDPKHVNYGGMAESASRWLTVPLLKSGQMVDVLTKQEKEFFEQFMNMPVNALSVHAVKDNYWSNFQVQLRKSDNYFHLNDPIEYIKFKVVKANKDIVAPSLDLLQEKPKATYEFVILRSDEEKKSTKRKVNNNILAYKELGKIEDDKDKLRFILETITNKPYTYDTPTETLEGNIDKVIQSDAKLFLKITQDPLFETKVLLRDAIDAGAVILRNSLFYVNGKPMCDKGDANMSVAAEWLDRPKNNELKLLVEGKVNAFKKDKE